MIKKNVFVARSYRQTSRLGSNFLGEGPGSPSEEKAFEEFHSSATKPVAGSSRIPESTGMTAAARERRKIHIFLSQSGPAPPRPTSTSPPHAKPPLTSSQMRIPPRQSARRQQRAEAPTRRGDLAHSYTLPARSRRWCTTTGIRRQVFNPPRERLDVEQGKLRDGA